MVIALDEKKEVKNSRDVVEIMTNILNMEEENDQMKEHFWVLGLSVRNRIQYIELATLGTLTSTVITAREVYRLAIQKSVSQILIVHNHPSEDYTPSKADKEITNKLLKAGDILGVHLLDHIIITKDSGYLSMADSGGISFKK